MTCPYCEGEIQEGAVRLGYHMGVCGGCGSVVCLDDVADEVLAALYKDPGYYHGGCHPYGYGGESRRSNERRAPIWSDRLAAIASLTSGRHLLDVGPGMGGFVRFAQARGWHVAAVDAYPANELSAPVVPTIDDAAALGPFDAVCLFDVVEHLADPLALLQGLPELLAGSGCVVIASPNAGGASFRSSGFDWIEVRPPEHLAIPSHVGMEAALERAGLRLVRTVGHLVHTWQWPPIRSRLVDAQSVSGIGAKSSHFGLRALNRMLREVRTRLPYPAPALQDYVTWLAQQPRAGGGKEPLRGSGSGHIG